MFEQNAEAYSCVAWLKNFLAGLGIVFNGKSTMNYQKLWSAGLCMDENDAAFDGIPAFSSDLLPLTI